MSTDLIIAILITVVGASTPILFAALGELVVEKSGVLNLGVEGMMLVGAVVAVAVVLTTGNPWLAVAVAAFAGAVAALIFGVLTLSLSANQVATGLALTILGAGFSALFGQPFTGQAVPLLRSPFPPEWYESALGRLVFGHSPLAYFSILMVLAVWWFLKRTRPGLILRAVGENDISAHSIGYPVLGVRYLAVAFGGAMAGIGGSCFPLMLTPQWVEGLTVGRGWIALALVVFATWLPWRLAIGALLFGAVGILQFHAQALGVRVPAQFLSALPYLITIVVLVLISGNRLLMRSNTPAMLGQSFVPDR
jgi:ABC-type uncharacterized transport system permease subunit